MSIILHSMLLKGTDCRDCPSTGNREAEARGYIPSASRPTGREMWSCRMKLAEPKIFISESKPSGCVLLHVGDHTQYRHLFSSPSRVSDIWMSSRKYMFKTYQ
ncbi:hypothetical protein PMIN03_010332 [Paraphaeosphaeria minitans]